MSSPSSDNHIEVVISRLESEPLDWVVPLTIAPNVLVTIYNKGTPLTKEETRKLGASRIVESENVGRESHAFMSHIVKHYKGFANATVFVPADLPKKVPETPNRITDPKFTQDTAHGYVLFLAEQAKQHGLSQNAMSYDVGAMSAHWHLKMSDKWPGVFDSKKLFGEWYEEVFQEHFPMRKIKWYKDSIFAARSDVIERVSLQIWKAALQQVSTHHDPEANHYMQRTWYEVMNSASSV